MNKSENKGLLATVLLLLGLFFLGYYGADYNSDSSVNLSNIALPIPLVCPVIIILFSLMLVTCFFQLSYYNTFWIKIDLTLCKFIRFFIHYC